MTTLNTAAEKHHVTAKRSNALARVLLMRKVNLLLAKMGQALNMSAMALTK